MGGCLSSLKPVQQNHVPNTQQGGGGHMPVGINPLSENDISIQYPSSSGDSRDAGEYYQGSVVYVSLFHNSLIF